MALENPTEQIPWRQFEAFLKACQEEAGTYSLRMFMQQAELPGDYLDRLRSEQPSRMPAESYARMQQLMRDYYGTGGRGLLKRVGRALGQQMIANFDWFRKTQMWLLHLTSKQNRRQVMLQALRELLDPDGERVSIHIDEQDLMWVDRNSPTTIGQVAEHPICYVTTGMLQATLAWITGSEHDVEEISCRACGAEACSFRIRG